MDTRETVVLGTLAVAMFNVGVVGLTQRVVYPVWTLVGAHGALMLWIAAAAFA